MSTSPDGFRPLLASAPVVPRQRRTPLPAFPAPTAYRGRTAVAPQFLPLVEPGVDDPATKAVHERARAAGFAAGYAAGARHAAQEAHEQAARAEASLVAQQTAMKAANAGLVTALTAAAQALGIRQAPVLAQAEARLHVAAVELAEAILGVELSDAPTSARAALARALSGEHPAAVTVRMNPRDIAALDALGDDVPTGVRIVADPSLAVGDAMAEHAEGALDARIGAALTRARAVLAQAGEHL
ncbi:MAG: flagellar assembly protein FliH [Actinobacteria bacterium]|nr:flagellar assembly protein FliH [Actinomycetota bacterium]